MAKTLTTVVVMKLKPGAVRREVPDAGCPGLYLVIQPNGKKSWAVRYKRPVDGTSAKLTLGTADVTAKEMVGEPVIGGPLTLAAARQLASEERRKLAMGRDPGAERKQERHRKAIVAQDAQRTKFALTAQDYVAQQSRDKKANRTWWKTALVLGLDFSDTPPTLIKGGLAERWQDRPVSEITRRDVHAVVDEARATAIPGRKPRTRGPSGAREKEMIDALSGMFKWLLKRQLVDFMPTTGLEREPSVARDRVLDDEELLKLWKACDDGPFGRAVKMMLLSGQRRSEVAGMRRSELSSDGTWTIPPARTKNKRLHVVPLPAMARELIEDGDSDFVFTHTGRGPVVGFGKFKHQLDEEMKIPEWRFHDLRHTAVTGMAEIGIAPHIIEAVVNHASGHKDKIAGHYNHAKYTEPKRVALERWAAHVRAIITGKEDITVVPMKAVEGLNR